MKRHNQRALLERGMRSAFSNLRVLFPVLILLGTGPFCRADLGFMKMWERANPAGAPQELAWNSLPSSVNLRAEFETLGVNYVTQGGRNSCAAFSATTVLEFQLRRLGHAIDLSEQYTLWAAKTAGADPGQGLWVGHLYDGLKEHGICVEELMPYKSSDTIIEPTPQAIADAMTRPPIILRHVVVPGNEAGFSDEEIFTLCKALSRHEPVCLGTQWANSTARLGRGYVVLDRGIGSDGHMVVLIGYEFDPLRPSEGWFFVRNPWGISWGDFGYAKVPFAFVRKHGLIAVQFRFDLREPEPPEAAAHQGAAAESGGLIRYVAVSLGIVALAMTMGFQGAALALIRQKKKPAIVLGYLLKLLPVWAALLLAGDLLTTGGIYNALPAGGILKILAVSALALLAVFKVTMRHFDQSFQRALGFLVMAGLLSAGIRYGASALYPEKSFQTWREQMSPVSALEIGQLLRLPEHERGLFIEQSRHRAASNRSEIDEEREWLMEWKEDLTAERNRIRPGNSRIAQAYNGRLAEYGRQANQFRNRAATTASGSVGSGP